MQKWSSTVNSKSAMSLVPHYWRQRSIGLFVCQCNFNPPLSLGCILTYRHLPKSFNVKDFAFFTGELLALLFRTTISLQYLYWLEHWNQDGWTKELINESHETIQRSSYHPMSKLSVLTLILTII